MKLIKRRIKMIRKLGVLIPFFIIIAVCSASSQAPDTLWTNIIGTSDIETICCVEPTVDGGYICVGGAKNGGSYDVYLVKIDANGDSVWAKYYGDHSTEIDYGCCVKQTTDRGYIIAGYTKSTIETYDEEGECNYKFVLSRLLAGKDRCKW
jgi:hypothetical protein